MVMLTTHIHIELYLFLSLSFYETILIQIYGVKYDICGVPDCYEWVNLIVYYKNFLDYFLLEELLTMPAYPLNKF